MAVTLLITELAVAIRAGDAAEETAELTRLLATATEMVTNHVAICPDSIHNEAVIRVCGYLYDAPTAGRTGNVLRLSGAAALLLPYRIHRAGLATSDALEAAQAAVGTVGNPVIGVDVVGEELVITFADGTTETHILPAGGVGGVDQDARDITFADGTTETHILPAGGVGGVDQDARDSAAAAQGTADTNTADVAANASALATLTANQSGHEADANAHHVPPTGGSIFDGERLPGGAVAMRIGWGQTADFVEANYVRADNHPLDGVSVGTTAGLLVPPFPPSLASDLTLYLGIWIAYTGDVPIRQFPSDPITFAQPYFSAPVALTVDGTVGQSYTLQDRQDADTYAAHGNEFFLTLPGELIASQLWVEEQIAAIPAGGGGDSFPSYHQALQSSNLN